MDAGDPRSLSDQAQNLESPTASASPRQLEKVRDIVLCFSNAVSALKVFPPDHQTVKQFVQDLNFKLSAYLKIHQQIDIAVKEFSFLFEGKPVYRDTTVIKSLPFFFFKDGLQTLSFYEGLDREEIRAFLDTIREESMKSPEEADIVAAMWERDFVNIHFYAPDDFLEAKIIEKHNRSAENPSGKDILDAKIDSSGFSEGRIDLMDGDRRRAEYQPSSREEFAEILRMDVSTVSETGDNDPEPIPNLESQMDEEEQQATEELLRKNRSISMDEEYIELMMELLNMQTDPREFESALDSLVKYNLELVQNRNFPAAIMLIQKIRGLFNNLADRAPEKTAKLQDFLKSITSDKTLAAMKKLVERKALDSSLDAFINYMIILGRDALPLAADFYESVAADEVRWRLENFFMTSAGTDLGALVALANDLRPEFSMEVIRILGRQPDKRAVPQFALFLGFHNSEVKRAVIQALGEIHDDLADKILAGFLDDTGENVRILAADKILALADPSRLAQLINRVKSKRFHLLSLEEKKAVLALIGRTATPECLDTLRMLLRKKGIFRNRARLETRLASISGLEACTKSEASDVLKKHLKSRSKKIREACRRALDSRLESS